MKKTIFGVVEWNSLCDKHGHRKVLAIIRDKFLELLKSGKLQKQTHATNRSQLAEFLLTSTATVTKWISELGIEDDLNKTLFSPTLMAKNRVQSSKQHAEFIKDWIEQVSNKLKTNDYRKIAKHLRWTEHQASKKIALVYMSSKHVELYQT